MHNLRISVLGLLLAGGWSLAGAQTPTTKRPPQPPVIVERKPTAPQVITVLHRINGLTMLRALVRSGQQVSAFENFEDAFQMKAFHTNIIAGLALDDGETIAAWLPEAEVEMGPMLRRPAPPTKPSATTPPARPSPRAFMNFGGSLFDAPDITIIERDGSRHRVRYVGLDGITGLSLLQLSEKTLPPSPIKVELSLAVGERMRLYSPEPVAEAPASTTNIYVRVGESTGEVVSVIRGRGGEVNRLRIKAAKLSASNIGAVVVNDAGQTIGIVESVEGGEANVLPPAAIRAAAKRVLARQASVPRPWLGVSGEPVALTSVDRFVLKGWDTQRAMTLVQARRGILLNSVAPGSPAAQAALRDGDVIVMVNNDEVKTNDDFSLLLAEAASKPVDFTVVRRNGSGSENVVIELSQQFDPLSTVRAFVLPPEFAGKSLFDHGIETVPLRPSNSMLTGPASGLLVIFVEPDSAAFKAGLMTADVIEAIDGKPVSALTPGKLEIPPSRYTLKVLRNKEKLLLTVVEDDK
ncbi:MAG TPA: PDZ domain-containing protein [Pyrinomonadaceae bacterium]|nr:PDZ domain-containing protein [Pyrinomonadaceae bacterium]